MGLFSSGGSAKQRKKTRTFSDLQGAAAATYVDTHADLSAAYEKIMSDPGNPDSVYWLQRMGGESTKAAFGEAHRGEDTLLFQGKYRGGTAVVKEDPKYFSAAATMREEGGEVGLRAKKGPATVAKEKEKTSESTESTSESTSETTAETTSETVTTSLLALISSLTDAIANMGNTSTAITDATTDVDTSTESNIVKTAYSAADIKKSVLSLLGTGEQHGGHAVVDPSSGTVYNNPAAARTAGITNWVYWYKWLDTHPDMATTFTSMGMPVSDYTTVSG